MGIKIETRTGIWDDKTQLQERMSQFGIILIIFGLILGFSSAMDIAPRAINGGVCSIMLIIGYSIFFSHNRWQRKESKKQEENHG